MIHRVRLLRRTASRLLPALAIGAAIVAAPVSAQTDAAPDPDRLETARGLIDLVMPPATREAMILQMIEPSMQLMQQAIADSPQIAAALQDDPAARERFAAFVAEQQQRSRSLILANLPGLMDAMAIAYARRFSEDELDDIAGFFRSRSGRSYLAQAPLLMADPAITSWQRSVMAQAMQQAQPQIAALAAELGVDPAAGRPASGGVNSYLDAMRVEEPGCVSGDADCEVIEQSTAPEDQQP